MTAGDVHIWTDVGGERLTRLSWAEVRPTSADRLESWLAGATDAHTGCIRRYNDWMVKSIDRGVTIEQRHGSEAGRLRASRLEGGSAAAELAANALLERVAVQYYAAVLRGSLPAWEGWWMSAVM